MDSNTAGYPCFAGSCVQISARWPLPRRSPTVTAPLRRNSHLCDTHNYQLTAANCTVQQFVSLQIRHQP
jgi:hypothetical protein